MNDSVFNQIKNQLTCVDYARQLGWEIHKAGDRTFSLDKGSNDTCLIVHDEYWFDFKQNKGGDVIDLSAEVNHNGDRSGALKELTSILNIKNNSDGEWKEYTQNLCNTIELWHTRLRQQDYEYLHKRGITNDTIKQFKLGFNEDRIIIPYFKNGYVAYWAGRATLPTQKSKYKKAYKNGLNDNIIWGLNTLSNNSETLVIAEGAFDALSFAQEKYAVVSPIGGHFPKKNTRELITICKNYKETILCFDSDNSGQQFTLKLAKILLTNKIPFKCVEIENYKDVSDYYVANKNLDFMQNKTDGVHYIGTRMETEEEFKKFIKEIARYTPQTTLIKIFNSVKDKFDNEWLKVLKKQAMSCPTDDFIVKEINKKHILKDIKGVGFHEYLQGVWRRKEDKEIKGIIRKELGYYASGSKINSVNTVLSSELFTAENFNKQHIVNFKNGILNIETGELLPHAPSYTTTAQLNYNYVPEVYSTAWIDFLMQITNNNEQKVKLLQEIFGYILYPDNSLQTCFVMMGEGADGKSKMFEVIQHTLGDENCTSIDISELANPNQVARLYNSVFNISSETNSNVKEASQVFKKIVAGDKVSGCHKYKDPFDFWARTKMIMAANNMLRTDDISHGFDRRIFFVDFPLKFVSNPIYENERKKNPNVIDNILLEKTGVFNWIYEGYKRLRENKDFTYIPEQDEIKNEFREMNNSIYAFLKELDYTNYQLQKELITSKDFYPLYKEWAREEGRMIKSQTSFARDLKKTVQSFYQDRLEYCRTTTQKGYKLLAPF